MVWIWLQQWHLSYSVSVLREFQRSTHTIITTQSTSDSFTEQRTDHLLDNCLIPPTSKSSAVYYSIPLISYFKLDLNNWHMSVVPKPLLCWLAGSAVCLLVSVKSGPSCSHGVGLIWSNIPMVHRIWPPAHPPESVDVNYNVRSISFYSIAAVFLSICLSLSIVVSVCASAWVCT